MGGSDLERMWSARIRATFVRMWCDYLLGPEEPDTHGETELDHVDDHAMAFIVLPDLETPFVHQCNAACGAGRGPRRCNARPIVCNYDAAAHVRFVGTDHVDS